MDLRVGLTGTPGTGKTTVAKRLDGIEVIHLNEFAEDHGLVEDDGAVDTKLLDTYLGNELADRAENARIVLEGHLAHMLSELDGIVVLRCAPEELAKRLSKRDWSQEKLRENMEAEALGVVATEAEGRAGWVYEVETADTLVDEVVELVDEILDDPNADRFQDYQVGWVDHLDEVLDWY